MPLFDVGSNLVADLETATVVENHLPAWLQAVVTTAPLYASDSSDQVLARLPRHTFLRVLGGGTARLQVVAYDENGDPGKQGWVDPNQVLPSAPGTDRSEEHTSELQSL